MTATRAGLLIAFEGIDGAGKSTQVDALVGRLEREGIPLVRTREPTDGPWGRKIRQSAREGRMSPEDEASAFIEDRKQHVAELIAPALEAGKVVIIDRYYFSTVAYQGARGLPTDELLARNSFAPQPDLLLIVDIEPRVGLQRVHGRGAGADLFENERELNRVREIFRTFQGDWVRWLDGTRPSDDLASEIGEIALAAVRAR